MIYSFANKKKNEYGKKYISRAVLCERQQGEERNCPYHGTAASDLVALTIAELMPRTAIRLQMMLEQLPLITSSAMR